ncbi:hypothetical protein J6590_040575 [Homalodisca vitripennis]|nr:hypothetical protein J6590_040575 [Homalodisca vitripennis]
MSKGEEKGACQKAVGSPPVPTACNPTTLPVLLRDSTPSPRDRAGAEQRGGPPATGQERRVSMRLHRGANASTLDLTTGPRNTSDKANTALKMTHGSAHGNVTVVVPACPMTREVRS